MKRLIYPLLIATFCGTTGCKSTPGRGNDYAQPANVHHFNPTASEAFRLRSECVKLGQKILDGENHGAAVTVDMRSNYDPESNRCYVELDTTTYDASKPNYGRPNYVTENERFLYDGQTNEMLAYFINPLGDKQGSGIVFVNHRRTVDPNIDQIDPKVNRFTAADNYDTQAFIDRAMGDDLPQ